MEKLSIVQLLNEVYTFLLCSKKPSIINYIGGVGVIFASILPPPPSKSDVTLLALELGPYYLLFIPNHSNGSISRNIVGMEGYMIVEATTPVRLCGDHDLYAVKYTAQAIHNKLLRQKRTLGLLN